MMTDRSDPEKALAFSRDGSRFALAGEDRFMLLQSEKAKFPRQNKEATMCFHRITVVPFLLLLIFSAVELTATATCQAAVAMTLALAQQQSDFQAKFDELPAEYRERARQLGYKPGDSVTLSRNAAGNLVVLPPVEGNKSVEQMKAKLLQVLADQVLKKVAMPLDVKATLNPDDFTGYFTVESKFQNLKDDFQKEASKLGFKKDDPVKVRVDATTWAAKVAEKEVSFPAQLVKIIPPKEANGKPTLVIAVKFDDMTPAMQRRAGEAGYGKGDTVVMQDNTGGTDWEHIPRSSAEGMLPRPTTKPSFAFGFRYTLAELDKKEQDKARKLGYKEGDTVWKQLDSNTRKAELVPAAQAVGGPRVEIVGAEIRPATFNSPPEITMIGITKFDNLRPDLQVTAAQMKFKSGDMVGVAVRQGSEVRLMSVEETRKAIEDDERSRQMKQQTAPKKN